MIYPNQPNDPLSPQDPVRIRQARQGKPVLAILTISLLLAVVAGTVLWGAVADDGATAFMEPHPETASPAPQHSALNVAPSN